MLPKSVTPSRVEENLHGAPFVLAEVYLTHAISLPSVFELPEDLFNKLEEAATAHTPQRVVNPFKGWNLGFDVFQEDWPL